MWTHNYTAFTYTTHTLINIIGHWIIILNVLINISQCINRQYNNSIALSTHYTHYQQ